MVVLVVLVVLFVAGVAAGVFVVRRSRRRIPDEAPISSADRIEASMPPATDESRVLTAGPTPARLALAAAPDDQPATDDETADAAKTDEAPAEHIDTVEPAIPPAADSVPVSEPVIVLTDESALASIPDIDRERDVDEVVRALIERVRNSANNDVVAVVSEMVDRDLDTDQMEEVLGHLVERDAAALPKRDELTLTGPDVPQRPGRLSAFGEMGDREKRRVIIRVLCLLIARSEDQAARDEDERPLYTVELPQPDGITELDPAESTARDLWGDPDDDIREAHLPARPRRLARSRP